MILVAPLIEQLLWVYLEAITISWSQSLSSSDLVPENL